jgi:excisionase family DNA binding protein
MSIDGPVGRVPFDARGAASRPQAAGQDVSRPLTRADVMDAGDVAALLGIARSTVDEWARRGDLPSRKRGRRRLFLRWEVEAWLMRPDGR